jgi:hypothetical protein
MFIERSAAKIRRARTLFVLLGILPCAVLVGWAVVWRSESHRDAIRGEAERALGMPIVIGAVDHVRPGGLRLRGCGLVGAAGEVILAMSDVEVEATADEVRVRLPAVRCGPEAVAALVRIARAWLDEPVRFRRAWIVEVGSWEWTTAGSGRSADEPMPTASTGSRFPLRIECVAAGEARAVRVFRETGEAEGDEIRVITTAGSPCRHEVRATIRQPLPWNVIRPALPPALAAALSLGTAAVLTGNLDARFDDEGWSGIADGLVEDVDLEEVSAGRPHRLGGLLAVAIERLEWRCGRLEALRATGAAARGRISQSLLGALVSACGCRPGPAFHSLAGEVMRPFDDLSVAADLNADRLMLKAGPNRGGSLARRQGLSLVDEPSVVIPLARLGPLLGAGDGGILTRF